MIFEWDENKNNSNKQKHRLNFNDTKKVFNDKNKIISVDERKDYKEKRWKIIGEIYGVIISMIFTIRGTKTRIISARKASKKERKEYNNQNSILK